jgi:acyl dehydratase
MMPTQSVPAYQHLDPATARRLLAVRNDAQPLAISREWAERAAAFDALAAEVRASGATVSDREGVA